MLESLTLPASPEQRLANRKAHEADDALAAKDRYDRQAREEVGPAISSRRFGDEAFIPESFPADLTHESAD